MGLNFSGRHYPSDIIMMALRYYLAYKLSYREIEEIFAERNIHFDHSTLNRWVIKYAPLLETGVVSNDEVGVMIASSRGNEYSNSPHHLDKSIDVHIVKVLNKGQSWYIKWYISEPVLSQS